MARGRDVDPSAPHPFAALDNGQDLEAQLTSPTTDKDHEQHSVNPPLDPDQVQSPKSSDESRESQESDRTWQREEKHRVEEQGARLRRTATATDSLRQVRSLSRDRSHVDATKFTHPLSHVKTNLDVLVTFDGPGDLYNPINWPFRKKVFTTALYGFTTMGASLATSIYSAGTDAVAREFHVGQEVATLGTALLLFGVGLGPLFWGPLSELFGRKASVLTPYFVAAVFLIGTATAKDIQTVLITRFFAGFFCSAPITNTGGVMSDLWNASSRGTAIVCYAIAVVGGPTLGPIIGGAIVQSYLGWRWTEYLTAIYMFFVLSLGIMFLDETHPSTLLVYKAQRLRHETGNWALHAKHEEWDVGIKEMAEKYLIRPFWMLSTPICLAICSYASFVYAIFYAQLASFPIIFQEDRGFGAVTGALPFLALLIGIFLGSGLNVINNQYYIKAYKRAGNRPVPEARLPPMAIGGVFFSGGLFMFAWTSVPPSIPWIVPCIALGIMGASFFMIFQAALNYLVDTFQRFGASAIAANTFLRSALAGAFPLFITPMYHNMGPRLAGTVFAAVSVLLIPIPYLFMTFGKRIRARGIWSRESVYD